MAHLIVKNGRLCMSGGRLVTSAGGAPCVCAPAAGCAELAANPPATAVVTVAGMQVACCKHPCDPQPPLCQQVGVTANHFTDHGPGNGSFALELTNVEVFPSGAVHLSYFLRIEGWRNGQTWGQIPDPDTGVLYCGNVCDVGGGLCDAPVPLVVTALVRCLPQPDGRELLFGEVGFDNDEWFWGGAGLLSEAPWPLAGEIPSETCCTSGCTDEPVNCVGTVGIAL